MIKTTLFLLFTLVEIAGLTVLMSYATYNRGIDRENSLQAKRQLVSHLDLTDFAIWTEARYTRHPSQTDFFSPFQDFPGSLEHFPAGSVIAPPRNINMSETP